MLIETFALYNLDTKEHLGWDSDSVLTIIVVILWVILWIIAVIHAIFCARKKNLRNTQAGIVLSVLSWPFYFVFYLTGALNVPKR